MMPTHVNIIYTDHTDLTQACLNNMNFLSLKWNWLDSARNVSSGEEQGETMFSQAKRKPERKGQRKASALKGQCPDYAHARASSVFSSKDNRTVILTRQDFLPDRTADGDLLLTFYVFRLIYNLARGTKNHRDFIASRTVSRPEKMIIRTMPIIIT